VPPFPVLGGEFRPILRRAVMTERLYYDDSYNRDFEASVVRVDQRGLRQAVWLDRSSFYPASGGQPFDTGTLEDRRVVDVEVEEDDVVHLIEGPVLAPGQRIRGLIDWARRFDHMQQHTGQHVLSAAFVRSLQARTVSFHLGEDVSTIDLAADLDARQISKAEDDANRVVWENRPVTVRYAAADAAATLGLRKASARSGTLRLIDIEDFDLSACGGSHVRGTGEVGVVAVAAWERFKGGQRIEFVCGARALRHFRSLRDTSLATTRLLSVPAADIPGAVERLQQEAREQKRAIAALESELVDFRAEALMAGAEQTAHASLILRVIDAPAPVLKSIAAAIAGRSGFFVALVSANTPAVIVIARSSDVALACDAFVKALCARFGARGGGKADLAQAGGLNGSGDDILAELRRLLAASG
jgi:alanyl-tRNA synthetase